MTMEAMAHVASPSHIGPWKYPQFPLSMIPKNPISNCQAQRIIQLNTLKVESNIQSQASVLSTVGTINGNSTKALVNRANANLRFSSTASHMPRTVLNTVAAKVKTTVFQADRKNISLLNIFTKLSNPMNFAGCPTSLSVSDIQTPKPKGYARNIMMRHMAGTSNV